VGGWHDIHPAGALQGPQRGRKTDTHPNHHRVAHNRTYDCVAHYRTCHDGTCHLSTCHLSTCHHSTNHHSTNHHSTNHIGSHGYG
jgi:hypothetical protein